MPKTTTSLETPLRAQLDRLATFEPTELPVLSLYVDMRPDQHGRTRFDQFLRKALMERAKTLDGASRESFDRDVERIDGFLAEDVQRSANGLAIFACHGASLWETIQMTAPIDQHWLFVGRVPHLYPLARVNDQYPRYAALVMDTNAARLFVFSLGVAEIQQAVRNVKTRKASVGGWSQARYERHVENFHLHHAKEVVEVLDRVVREEAINQIVISCEERVKPTLMQQMPKHLVEKVVDMLHMDINTPEHQVLRETLEVLRVKDAETDQEHVTALLDAWRAGGLGVTGPEDTLQALEMGQVEELLITAAPDALRPADTEAVAVVRADSVDVDTSAPNGTTDAARLTLADDLVAKAQATGARIRFIEEASLLREVGGVGALLRFKI